MAKKKYINYKKQQQELFKRTEGYAAEVRAIYLSAMEEIINLVKGTELEDGKPFSFADYNYSEEVTPILRNMYSRTYQVIRGGVEKEWLQSNEHNDGLVKSVFGEHSIEDNHFAKLFLRNKEAMDAFFARKTGEEGLNLSQKVWKYNGMFKEELENALDLAIGEGTPANRLATKIKCYLQEPDKFYRRFRIKVGEDEEGNPIYGRIWKRRIWDKESESYKWVNDDPKKYHPGQGVYRSSYRNAQRLARTETNIAYRTADYTRWQQFDFVVGIEIKLSNNHPVWDICDELKGVYPKTFKWTGWHPNCRCYMVPKLAAENELDEMLDKILNDEDTASVKCQGEIKGLPGDFDEWMKRNEFRVAKAQEKGTLPYFLRDNKKLVGLEKATALDIAKIRHDSRTEQDIANIKKLWWERKATYHYGRNIFRIMDGISDVDTSALKEALKHPDLSAIMSEADKLKTIGKEIYSLDKLDNPMQVAKDFSWYDAKLVNNAVSNKLAMMSHDTLTGQQAALKYEIEWVTKHKKYKTSEVAAKAYQKALDSVNLQLGNEKPSAKKVKFSNVSTTDLEKYCDQHRTYNSPVVDMDSFNKFQNRGLAEVGEAWNNGTDEARRAIRGYTNGTYDSINASYWRDKKGCKNGQLMDTILDKCILTEDTVLRRGCDFSEMYSIFGNDFGKLMDDMDIAELNKMAGHRGINEGFISTSWDMTGGFKKQVDLRIFAPKGTQAFYAKPVSGFGDGYGADWDGKSAKTEFYQGRENETIVHRGYEYRFIKAEKGGLSDSKITIYIELLTRDKRTVK